MTAPIPLPAPGAISLENWGIPLTQRVNAHSTQLSLGVFVSETTAVSAVSGITNVSETLHISNTFTADGTSRYRAEYSGQWQGTVAGDFFLFRIRWAVGPTVTNTGTLLRTQGYHVQVAARDEPIIMMKSWIPPAGQVTVGFFCWRSSGGGSASLAGDVNANTLLEIFNLS